MKNKVEVSYVLPVLDEEDNVEKLIKEAVDILEKFGRTYEIIAVNIPGNDSSWEKLVELGKKYDHFYPVNIKTRVGSGKIAKGYQYRFGFILAKGDFIIHSDSDYEDDPADIPNMVKKLEEGYDLVVGWRINRKHGAFYKASSKVYNFFSNLLTGINIHDKNCGIKAYSKPAAKAVKFHGRNFRGIPILLSARGYKVTEIPVNNRERIGGVRKWSFTNRFMGGTVDFISNVVISNTGDTPFRFWGILGITFSIIATILWLVYGYLAFFTSIDLMKGLFVLGIAISTTLWSSVVLVAGLMMEFMLHNREITLEDFTILGDPKNRVNQS